MSSKTSAGLQAAAEEQKEDDDGAGKSKQAPDGGENKADFPYKE